MKNLKFLFCFVLAMTAFFAGDIKADAYHGIPKWDDSSATGDDCTTCHYEGGKHVPPPTFPSSHNGMDLTAGGTYTVETGCGCHSEADYADGSTAPQGKQDASSAMYDAGNHGGTTNCGACHTGAPNLTFNDNTTSDVDGDGLSTKYEASIHTDDTKADTDGDGKTDYQEINGYENHNAPGMPTAYSNPTSIESDHDGLYDSYEVANGLNPGQPGDKTNGGAGMETPYEITVVTGESITTTTPIVWDATKCEPDDVIRPTAGTLSAEEDSMGMMTGNWTYTASKTSNGVTTPTPVGTDTFAVQWVDMSGGIQRANVTVNIVDPQSDDDEDGLTWEEENELGTDPNNPDTDGDGWYDKYDEHPTVTDILADASIDEITLGDGEVSVSGTLEGYDVTQGTAVICEDAEYGTITLDLVAGTWTYTQDVFEIVGHASETLTKVDSFTIQYPSHDMTTMTTSLVAQTVEITVSLTETTSIDTDLDGQTDDVDADDDNDGFSDADEIAAGTDPLDATSFPVDNTDPTDPLEPTDPTTDPNESTNPETSGTAGLMLSLGITTVAGAGLVVFRKRK